MTNALTRYRQENNLSQSAFADLIGVTRWHVNRIERGERHPSRDLIGRIIAATGGKVSASDFFGAEAASEPS